MTSTRLATICLALILLGGILTYLYEIRLNTRICLLEKKLNELDKFRCAIDEVCVKEPCIESQILSLNKRADNLRFCYLCPLYQEKVREDTRQMPPTNRG